jgi:hypothetical protein
MIKRFFEFCKKISAICGKKGKAGQFTAKRKMAVLK